jgi:hypothetical protein
VLLTRVGKKCVDNEGGFMGGTLKIVKDVPMICVNLLL